MGDEVDRAVPVEEVREGERRCPVCGGPMQVRTMDNVRIDVCDFHGVWLDRGELEKLLGKDPRRRATRRRIEEYRKAAKDESREGWAVFDLLDVFRGRRRRS